MTITIIIIIIIIIGKLIMVVIRTMEQQVGITKSVRRQHLFVITPSTNTDTKSTAPLYVVSWGSKYSPSKCTTTNSNRSNNDVRDGNHPNWVPDTHQISMNLYYQSNADPNSNYNIVLFDIDKMMILKHNRDSITNTNDDVYMKQIYHLGTGHPTLTPNVILSLSLLSSSSLSSSLSSSSS
jgi:hypothetical protein